MGTKYCPEAPRQRMISLMYLVLTAMLALNVDKSVLDAFVFNLKLASATEKDAAGNTRHVSQHRGINMYLVGAL